ncbi:hypothetical protein JOM56_002809 [Amanita muscaria]
MEHWKKKRYLSISVKIHVPTFARTDVHLIYICYCTTYFFTQIHFYDTSGHPHPSHGRLMGSTVGMAEGELESTRGRAVTSLVITTTLYRAQARRVFVCRLWYQQGYRLIETINWRTWAAAALWNGGDSSLPMLQVVRASGLIHHCSDALTGGRVAGVGPAPTYPWE